MPDEESQTLDNNNAPENNEAATDGSKPQPAASQGGGGSARVVTPEGLIMLTVGATLDGAGLSLLVLDLLFGIGAAVGPFVSVAGYGSIFLWQMARSLGGDKGGQALNNNLLRLLKKQGWKMGLEAVPFLDALPMFTSMIYSELKNSNN